MFKFTPLLEEANNTDPLTQKFQEFATDLVERLESDLGTQLSFELLPPGKMEIFRVLQLTSPEKQSVRANIILHFNNKKNTIKTQLEYEDIRKNLRGMLKASEKGETVFDTYKIWVGEVIPALKDAGYELTRRYTVNTATRFIGFVLASRQKDGPYIDVAYDTKTRVLTLRTFTKDRGIIEKEFDLFDDLDGDINKIVGAVAAIDEEGNG